MDRAYTLKKIRKANALGRHRCRLIDRFYEDIPTLVLFDLLKSQLFLCPYCDRSITELFHLDHIQPLSRGGEHVLANLQFTCIPCNLEKWCKTNFTGTLYVEPPPLPEPAIANDPDTVEECNDWPLSPH